MANESPESKSFAAAAKSLMETTETLKDTTKTLKETNNTIAISQGDTASAIKDALGKPLNLIKSEITAPFENIKSAFGMIPGNKILRGLGKDIMRMGQEDRARSEIAASNQAEDEQKNRFQQKKILGTQDAMLKALKAIMKNTAGILKLASEKGGKLLGFLFGLLLSPIRFLQGLIGGIGLSVGRIGKLLRAITNIFTFSISERLLRGLGKGFANLPKILTSIRNLILFNLPLIGSYFRAVDDVFKKSGTGQFLKASTIARLGDNLDAIKDMAKNLNEVSLARRYLNKFLGPISDFLMELRNIRAVGNAGYFTKIFGPLTNAFRTAFQTLSTFAKGLGGFIGRLFYPLALAIEIYNGIRNFIDGFKQEQQGDGILGIVRGLIGGIRDALAGLFENLIGVPLDLLKDLVAWGLKQIGFEETAALLKEFSFTDIIGDIIRWPYNQLLKVFDAIRNFDFTSLIPDFGDNAIGRGIKSLFGSGEKTPKDMDRDRQKRMRDLGMQISYRERGLKLMSPGKEGSAEFAMYTKQQSELNRLKAELESLRAGGGTTVINQNSVDASQNNNSTSVTTPPMTDPYTAWASASP